MSPEAITPAADPITTPFAATCLPMGVTEPVFTIQDRWLMVDALRHLNAAIHDIAIEAERIFA